MMEQFDRFVRIQTDYTLPFDIHSALKQFLKPSSGQILRDTLEWFHSVNLTSPEDWHAISRHANHHFETLFAHVPLSIMVLIACFVALHFMLKISVYRQRRRAYHEHLKRL